MLVSIVPLVEVEVSANLVLRTRMVSQSNTDFSNSSFRPNTYESEFFQFIWGGPGTGSTGSGGQAGLVTQAMLERNGRVMDTAWRVLIDDYGFTPPTRARGSNSGDHFKINVVIQNTGIRGHDNTNDGWGAFAGMDGQGFPFVMLVPQAMNGFSATAVHEFGHCVVFANGWASNEPVGPWHEAVSNYMSEIVLRSPRWAQIGASATQLSGDYRRYAWNYALQKASPRAYYQCWPLLIYVSENPDNLPNLGGALINRIIREATNHEPFFTTMYRLLGDTAARDVLGHYAKRMGTHDLGNGSNLYWNDINTHVGQRNNTNWGRVYTILEPTGNANTWAVPTDRAPQASGFNVIPVTLPAAGQVMSVTLNGLSGQTGADWRFSISIRDSNNRSHYSNLARPGQTATLTVPANAQHAFVSVTATPSIANFHGIGFPVEHARIAALPDHRETAISFNQKQRFPYEITLTNTAPREKPRPSGGVRHANGGGWVQTAANVDATVFVGPNAVVTGSATVRGNARIEDNAVVGENAQVSGNAIIGGSAVVEGRARVSGNAKVLGSTWLYSNFAVSGNAIAQGLTEGYGDFSVAGQGITDGDFYNQERLTFERGTIAGVRPQGHGVNWATFSTNRPFVDRMHYGYSFSTDASRIANDTHHSTYAVSYGNPLWESARTSATGGVLTLNGSSQYVNLSRATTQFSDIEIQTAVLWRGGAANQKIFHFGDSENFMSLTPSNADGRAEFVIRRGTTTQRLTATAALPIGRWTVITVRIIGNTGTLTFNTGSGTAIPTVTNTTMSLNPAEISSVRTNSAVYSLGRDNNGNFFNGSYHYYNVFFAAAPAPAYPYTATESSNPQPTATTAAATTAAPPATTNLPATTAATTPAATTPVATTAAATTPVPVTSGTPGATLPTTTAATAAATTPVATTPIATTTAATTPAATTPIATTAAATTPVATTVTTTVTTPNATTAAVTTTPAVTTVAATATTPTPTTPAPATTVATTTAATPTTTTPVVTTAATTTTAAVTTAATTPPSTTTPPTTTATMSTTFATSVDITTATTTSDEPPAQRLLGDADLNERITINDALEILKFLAKLDSVLNDDPLSMKNSLILNPDASSPSIGDALEILKFLAKLDSEAGVWVDV
jgi:hypothetical protein